MFSDTAESESEPLTESRWSLVSGLLKDINEHGQHFDTISDHNCVGESIRRSYRLGGERIKMGFRPYTGYKRKHKNRCELKKAACEKSRIVLGVEAVMRRTGGMGRDFTKGFFLTTALDLRPVQSWLKPNPVVCWDS